MTKVLASCVVIEEMIYLIGSGLNNRKRGGSLFLPVLDQLFFFFFFFKYYFLPILTRLVLDLVLD